MTIGILIADDQALVRAGFRMILEAEDDLRVVAEAKRRSATPSRRRVARRPDVVLMDIRMPGMDGLEATRRIMAAADEPPRVLMLTTFDLDEYVFDALRAGASGFLLKDVPPDSSWPGSGSSPQGDSLLAPSVTRRLIESFVRDAPARAEPPPRLGELTAREREVFAPDRPRPLQRRDRRRSSSSPARRSRHTWPGCSPSSVFATASRRSCSPTRPASSGRRDPPRISNDRAGTRASTARAATRVSPSSTSRSS